MPPEYEDVRIRREALEQASEHTLRTRALAVNDTAIFYCECGKQLHFIEEWKTHIRTLPPKPKERFTVENRGDGGTWYVIDGDHLREWYARFSTESDAREYAAWKNKEAK